LFYNKRAHDGSLFGSRVFNSAHRADHGCSELAHFSEVVQIPPSEWQTFFVQAAELLSSRGVDVG
jgi:hypothetical protein